MLVPTVPEQSLNVHAIVVLGAASVLHPIDLADRTNMDSIDPSINIVDLFQEDAIPPAFKPQQAKKKPSTSK